MKLTFYSTVTSTVIDNDLAKGVTARVVIGKEDGADHFCMRIFELAPGGHTPRHMHAWEHEIFFHQGSGEVYGNGAWHRVTAGAVVFIPGEEDHQIRNTGKEPLIFVCLIPAGAPEL